MLDYPAVRIDIDREKAGLSEITVRGAVEPVIEATSSSRFIALNYWVDTKTGFDYQVEVLVPPKFMNTKTELESLPLTQVNPVVNLMIRDVAVIRDGKTPGEIDRAASQRYLSINANVEGEDLGRAARQVTQAINAAGKPPRGVRVKLMGQLPPMIEMFEALGIGLAVAVCVILMLLTAYFQSPRLALISIGAVPGVLAGAVTLLYVTGSTLNIESFMGSIMCLGVSVSNSVLLVTFMNEHWQGGASTTEAAAVGAGERLRPILMTACAMTVGMLPMALGLERGSQMEVPLGRAVIGGLVMSTLATLLVLPSIFVVVMGRCTPCSPSLYSGDPAGRRYDPIAYPDLVGSELASACYAAPVDPSPPKTDRPDGKDAAGPADHEPPQPPPTPEES
jgi:multidrug efflux pump subunit AcrB